MEPIQYLLIAKVSKDSKWDVISQASESYEEIKKEYSLEISKEKALYKYIKIVQTVYG